ncbi:MAG TPA: ABC transporter substrate-binding protein [Bacillota bacterium]|nr:ABC transporter substrate-binding protein [Bacillota bacterium]
MKKILTIALLIFMVLNTAPGLGKVSLLKVRLNEVTHSVFYAPQYAALNLGFFENEGLDVELTNGQGTDKVMTALLTGQADIGFGGPEATIYVYNEGKQDHPVIFAQVTNRDGSFLMGRNPEPDFGWSHVKGKMIIGGRKGGMPEMTLEYVLKKNGLIPGKDVEVNTSIQFALMGPAFVSGQGDYVALFEPTASLLEKEGKGYIVTSIGKDSGEISYTAYFAQKSYLQKNAAVIQKFTNALYRGQIWVAKHSPAEIAKAIKSSFPDTDEELLTTVAARYKDQDTWNTDPLMKKKSFQLMQAIMETAGELKQQIPYEKIVDTSFALKALKSVKVE